MFSKELAILDRNTEEYMIEEMQKQLQEDKKLLNQQQQTLSQQQQTLNQQTKEIERLKSLLQNQPQNNL